MPTVPLLSPDVSPSGTPAPQANIAVSSDMFGGAIGHALSGLGQSLEGAGDRIWQRAVEMQNLNNETEAKDADAQYMMKAGQLHADFSALEGLQAKAAFPKYMSDLQSLRKEIRGGLSNSMAAKMFDASSLSVMGRTIFNGAGHAAQQSKVAASNASQARVDQMSDGVAVNPGDDLTFQRYANGIRAETQSQGGLHGWTPEQTKATADSNVSVAMAKRITALSRTDVFGAQKMFDTATKTGNLQPNEAMKVQASIQTQFRQVGSRMISDDVLKNYGQEDEDKGEAQYLADGMAAADKVKTDDPLFRDFVRERIMADYNRRKAVDRDGQQQAEQTVAAALMTGNKEGILPKSVDELKLINPEVSDAWDRMKPTTQKRYMRALAQNAQGERVAWTDDSLRTYQQLKGQAHDDPVEFLAHDVIGDKLPSSAKRELINLQQRLRTQSEADPRVTRAMGILSPDLRAAGIDKASDKEGYYQFVGAMQDQLDQFQKDHKKTPSMDEVKKIGAQLMQEQTTGRRGWLYFTDEKAPTYQLPVPEEEAERLKADPYWKANGITPNDSMIGRIYRAQKFKELYGGAAKKPAEASFPPNAPESK